MNAKWMGMQSLAAALVLIAGGIGCSHNDSDHRLSRAERRHRAPSDDSIARQEDRTYARRTSAYATEPETGMTATASASPTPTYVPAPAAEPYRPSPSPYDNRNIVAQDRTKTSSGGIQTAEDQHDAVTVTAPEAPPATHSETPGRGISNDEFWVNGSWRWESNTFVWKPGRIERKRDGQLYHPANWSESARGWDYTPAYWN